MTRDQIEQELWMMAADARSYAVDASEEAKIGGDKEAGAILAACAQASATAALAWATALGGVE